MSQETIHYLFEKQAKLAPQAVAACCEGQSISYGELNEKANQMAHFLQHAGVTSETIVALCLERSIELLITILGILKAGGMYVPLDPSHPAQRLLFTLQDSQTPFLISSSHLKEKFSPYSGTLIILDEQADAISSQSTELLDREDNAHQGAYIIYTSGSTGKPKGVVVEHGGVVQYAKWFADYSACQPEHRIDFSSNYIFDMAVTTSIVPLMLGLTVIICHDEIRQEVRHYLEYLATNEVNIIKITPSYLKVLLHDLKHHFIELPHLTTLILGGENLLSADCAAWLSHYPEHLLFNEYGPTETTVAVSTYQVSLSSLEELETSVSIGTVAPHVEYCILDENQRMVADGETGELHIGGICLARGYLNQPELSAQKFINNPFEHLSSSRLYKTGDVVKKRQDGALDYLGRKDDQIKIRGFRVEPAEIERNLASHPAIQDTVVLIQNDERHERLIAYYRVKEGHDAPNVNQLHDYLENLLPDYMIPAAFVRINELPLTDNGKLNKKALPIPRFTTNQHYLAPTTPMEIELANIWSEELDIKLVGIEDNFFELGGHSLSAARILSKINTVFGKDLHIHEFYEAHTIKNLTHVIEHAKDFDHTFKPHMISKATKGALSLGDFQLLLWLVNVFEPKAKKINIVARKRLQGHLDRDALAFAFQAVLQKHEVLSFRILHLRPAQRLQKNLSFNLMERDISDLSKAEKEAALHHSVDELVGYYPWPQKAPLLHARLFRINQTENELQLCMPHLVADDVSPEILFADLSKFYLSFHQNMKLDSVNIDKGYRNYQLNEQHLSEERINRDIIFWENYLDEVSLLSFPPKHIIKNMEHHASGYSAYTEIPESGLQKLQQFCAHHRVSINDGLCGLLGLALQRCCHVSRNKNQHIFINIVKSTRGHEQYDETTGCFLKLEPIKMHLTHDSDLVSLSKQVHQSALDTAPYQRCPSLIKLACIGSFRRKKDLLKQYLIAPFIFLYTTLFPTHKLHQKTLHFSERLLNSDRENNFLINLNVHQSFVSGLKKNASSELFGFKTKKIKGKLVDLLNIDQLLDICLLREDYKNTPYIVISANLDPDFKQKIAKEMIHIMCHETFKQASSHMKHAIRQQFRSTNKETSHMH